MNETTIRKGTIMKTLTLALLGLVCLLALPNVAHARYRDGMNLYQYVRSSPVRFVDPSGLTACPCKCDAGQKDLKDVVNDHVNKLITDAGGDKTKLFNSLVTSAGAFPNLTGIEEWLYQNHRADMTGVHEDFNIRGRTMPNPKRGAYAPCMRLCGECVGTDKVGHFFEEGFLYQQITALKGDSKYAIGLGEWLEGKVTTDADVLKWLKEGSIDIVWSGGKMNGVRIYNVFNAFGDNIPGYNDGKTAGMADLAANAAGMAFWDGFFPGAGGATRPASGPAKFNICDYVTDKWDENKNPNVKPDPKP